MTGAMDPGGNNLLAADYEALFDVWRRGQMTVRIAYSLNGQVAGAELEEFKSLTALLPMGFGDDMLHFNGLGERITVAMNNNPEPTASRKQAYYDVVKWAAERGMTITMHWGPNSTVDHLLTIFEQVNRETPIAPLRWSIAHLNDASEETLAADGGARRRMDRAGRDVLRRRSIRAPVGRRTRRGACRRSSRASELGVAIGAGTDAHRVASYNPFTALQWFLDGKTVCGNAIRGPEETPSRLDALRFYTLGSAWFSHDDDVRGSLEIGKLADLAVLSKDYLTVPVDEIGSIESLLTMVGGKVVYAAGDFD